jgi:Uma2 family endonuclease
MSTSINPVSAAQLLAMADDGNRYELIQGKLHMMSPAGGRHGAIAFELAFLLGQHVKANRLGVVFAAETGFRISTNPDTVRAPDVAFVTQARIDKVEDLDDYLNLAPDLVAEVVSPNDSASEVEAKAQMWLAAGTAMVLVVDPANESIRVYRTPQEIEVLRGNDQLAADPVVREWILNVAEVFPTR